MCIRTLRNMGGGCHGRLEEVQGGGQQEGRQGSHTPVDPKGSADIEDPATGHLLIGLRSIIAQSVVKTASYVCR
jgi:hypothetical protein